MKRFLHVTMLCLMLSISAVPAHADENQLENAVQFFQNASEVFQKPFAFSVNVDEQDSIITGEIVKAEMDGESTPALQITGDGSGILAGPKVVAAEEKEKAYGLDPTTLLGSDSVLLKEIQQSEWYDSLMDLYEMLMKYYANSVSVTKLPSNHGNTVSWSVHYNGEQLRQAVYLIFSSQSTQTIMEALHLYVSPNQLYEWMPEFVRNTVDATVILAEENDSITASLTGAFGYSRYRNKVNFDAFFQFDEPDQSETQPSFYFQARIGDIALHMDGENGILTGSMSDTDRDLYQVYGQYGWNSSGLRLAFEVTDVEENEVILTVSLSGTAQGLIATVAGGEEAFTLTLQKELRESGDHEKWNEFTLTLNSSRIGWNLVFSPKGIHTKLSSMYDEIHSEFDLSFTNPGLKGNYYDYRGHYFAVDTDCGKMLFATRNREESEVRFEQHLLELAAEPEELHLNYYEISADQLLYDTDTETFGSIGKQDPDAAITVIRDKDQLTAEYTDGSNTVSLSAHQIAKDWDDNLLKAVKVERTSVTDLYGRLSKVLFGR